LFIIIFKVIVIIGVNAMHQLYLQLKLLCACDQFLTYLFKLYRTKL